MPLPVHPYRELAAVGGAAGAAGAPDETIANVVLVICVVSLVSVAAVIIRYQGRSPYDEGLDQDVEQCLDDVRRGALVRAIAANAASTQTGRMLFRVKKDKWP